MLCVCIVDEELQRKHDPEKIQEALGLIPSFLDDEDPADAREQLDAGHKKMGGGGWTPQPGFTVTNEFPRPLLKYPGDAPLKPLAFTALHNGTGWRHAKIPSQIIIFYPYGLVLVATGGESIADFEVCRLD